MEIRSVRHKGLRRLMLKDDAAGLPQGSVAKIAAILSFLQDASGVDALKSVPTWRVHPLTGDRKGTWSLSVTRNWRITFRIDADGAVTDLDFEDYH
ncbi:MAG: type II toxin-antitoxin system RelE/ParE family toxin [Alphaproteobacteria bacterium]|nr:type II toxin-antitoxin system RelE/ParE family toxin [Alphaproteobacteria bacterium]